MLCCRYVDAPGEKNKTKTKNNNNVKINFKTGLFIDISLRFKRNVL